MVLVFQYWCIGWKWCVVTWSTEWSQRSSWSFKNFMCGSTLNQELCIWNKLNYLKKVWIFCIWELNVVPFLHFLCFLLVFFFFLARIDSFGEITNRHDELAETKKQTTPSPLRSASRQSPISFNCFNPQVFRISFWSRTWNIDSESTKKYFEIKSIYGIHISLIEMNEKHEREMSVRWPTITFNSNSTQHNITQHNTTQHNITQHNTTQHNTTQHNTTQHNIT